MPKQAWVVTADMGYGHARASYPLTSIAYDRIITANKDQCISIKEQHMWRNLRVFYETISRLNQLPFIGSFLFGLYDYFQRIEPLYTSRDLSRKTLAVGYMQHLIRKGLCSSLLAYIRKVDLPIVTPFYLVALAAEYHRFSKVYCIVTDTDFNRVWVAPDPKKSNITYFAPTSNTVKRLLEYGVDPSRVILTGFPLPKENLGSASCNIAKADLSRRLSVLDPLGRIANSARLEFGLSTQKHHQKRPLTLTYVVGGAGAHQNIARKMIASLAKPLRAGELRLNLMCGTRLEIASEFNDMTRALGIQGAVHIQISLSKHEYFAEFSKTLRETDVLWTKPSELSFYAALGIPLICSPPLGAHEEFNLRWLVQMGAGLIMDDPHFAHEWLFDWHMQGLLANAAINGWRLAPRTGTFEIERIITGKVINRKKKK